MPTVTELLQCLPPYQDKWIKIKDDQDVSDIITDIVDKHKQFAPYYDKIAFCFDAPTIQETCNEIVDFLHRNIKYQEETDKKQTTAIPTGILIRGTADCKQYSGFSAGILDALKRQGAKINWCYRFASYRIFDKVPHHVFVVVNPGTKKEIWLDPTPGADKVQPVWEIDKKVNMPLYSNIGTVGQQTSREYLDYEELQPGVVNGPYWQLMPVEGIRGKDGNHGTSPYFSGPFLALQHYAQDPYSVTGTDWNKTADAINQAIAAGPEPGHTVDADFVKWIYDTSNKGYNFYYLWGVPIGYKPNLPAWYPHPVITDDQRLTFDRDYKVDDAGNNDEIHALNQYIQSLIREFDTTPYILKPADLKLFSQSYTGNPGNTNANLFNEHRGQSFVKEVLKGLEKAVNFVKDGVLKIVGSIPRNAFLGLVGINAFNFAGNMYEKIQNGQWNTMAKHWENLGGNPDKLKNTIEDGRKKKAILGDVDTTNRIGVEPVTTSTTTLLAAAAPIIAAMLAFINDKDGKIKDVLSATKGFLQTKYPNIDLSAYGFLDKKTGLPLQYQVDPIDDENKGGGTNEMPKNYEIKSNQNLYLFTAGVGVATYLLMPKSKKRVLYAGAAAAGFYFLYPKLFPNGL